MGEYSRNSSFNAVHALRILPGKLFSAGGCPRVRVSSLIRFSDIVAYANEARMTSPFFIKLRRLVEEKLESFDWTH